MLLPVVLSTTVVILMLVAATIGVGALALWTTERFGANDHPRELS